MPTNMNRDPRNHTYQILRGRLISYTYEPGTVLGEAQLATDLGLSCTPVREAISRLGMDGFIRITPKKGVYVSDIQLNDVLRMFQTCYKIEPVVLCMATPHPPMEGLYEFHRRFQGDLTDIQNRYRLDATIHLFIIEYCGNRYVIGTMHKLFGDNARVIIASEQNQARIRGARHEHLEVIGTLIGKEYERAAAVVQTHIESCCRAVVNCSYSLQTFSSASPPTYEQRL